MEKFSFIEYHQTRDFSNKINATFGFIRQNFKGLTKSILFIAGPPILIASLLIGSFMNDFMSISQANTLGGGTEMQDYIMSSSFWLQFLLMLVLLTVSGVMAIATINGYIVLYEQKRTNEVEVSDVWANVRQTFWMNFGTMFMFMFLGMVVYIILIIPFALIVAVSPYLVFIGILLFISTIIYLAIGVSLTFFIRTYEQKGFFDALARSFSLIKGKWWSTFGIVFILYMIILIVSYLFLIPWYVIFFINAMHNIETGAFTEMSDTMALISLVLFTLYYLVQMILYALPNIGIAFQYFNLVELKEARGLVSQIETLGQENQADSNAPTHDEHY